MKKKLKTRTLNRQANSAGHSPQAMALARTAIRKTSDMLCNPMNRSINEPRPSAATTAPALPA